MPPSEARAAAFDDAKKRAQQYADLSELDLGDVVTITEANASEQQTPVVMNSEARDMSVPLEPGTQSVRFQVTVKWSLR